MSGEGGGVAANPIDYSTFALAVRRENQLWRRYRRRGKLTYNRGRSTQILPEDQTSPPGPIRYFEARKKAFRQYRVSAANQGGGITLSQNPRPSEESNTAQQQFRNLVNYFGTPRLVSQKVLGYGGNGMAAHFKDHGPADRNEPARDFVVKVSLHGRQDNGLEREKRMMKKVKGSAHCVQLIEPQDVGLPEETPKILQLEGDDSSIDGDSSGNESLTAEEVRARYRVVKRRDRSQQYQRDKIERRKARMEELRQQIEDQRKKDGQTRMDYIFMEFLPHGNLASLIYKHSCLESQLNSFVEIPNRVLWAFWLCLVRACIALEYPPRKFHPLRKKPEKPEGAIEYAVARANGMLRECRRLGLRVFYPERYEKLKAEYEQLEGDLIENIPNPSGRRADNWKRARRQNMVHGDFDATNIFINGLELDQPAPKHWPEEETEAEKGKEKEGENPSDQNETAPSKKTFASTGRRPDRVDREHEFIPRLKLGDFGIAECIKQQKANLYYLDFRITGKHGHHPPECFGPEWERMGVNEPSGDEIANSRIAGYLSNKTNIWDIGVTMWEMITGYSAPTPPRPQPPPGFLPVPGNQREQNEAMNAYMEDPANADSKISYCPLLLDPEGDYDWVDETLRETVYKCMYHRPDDRPTLEELLREAEDNAEAYFDGESDESIRDWIQQMFFDADIVAPPPRPRRSAGPPPPPEAINLDDPYGIRLSELRNGVRIGIRIKYMADFIGGFDLIPNAGNGLRCGIIAIVDSLRAQIGPNQQVTINGVVYNISRFPTEEDLMAIYGDLRDQGLFEGILSEEEIGQPGNFGISQLSAVFAEWARRRGVSNLELGFMQKGRGPLAEPGPSNNPKYIWIHNDNAQEIAAAEAEQAGRAEEGYIPGLLNHWEGMRPKPPEARPVPEAPEAPDGEHGSNSWLPDYESDEPDG